jgi:rSAM/selenodomain-associated transferase 1
VNAIVIAKAPVPGRAKTRLCPPCTPERAATLAEAALVDTLHAVRATPHVRRMLALDGDPGPWLPSGFDVVPQRGDGLDERLAAAFEDVGGPALLVGMDTPQMVPSLLVRAMRTLGGRGVDAVLGRAVDGGFWAIGLREPRPDVFLGVPMSTSRTGARQRERLDALGLSVAELPALRDVDRIEDAWAVAEMAPTSLFARALRSTSERVGA